MLYVKIVCHEWLRRVVMVGSGELEIWCNWPRSHLDQGTNTVDSPFKLEWCAGRLYRECIAGLHCLNERTRLPMALDA